MGGPLIRPHSKLYHSLWVGFPKRLLGELASLADKHYNGVWLLEQLLKIHIKYNFDRNQLKVSTQHKYMYMY